MSINFLVILLSLALMGACFAIAGFSGAVWVPTFSKDLALIHKRLDLKDGTNVYEFGCGDARFLRMASHRGAVAVGYEINPIMAVIAKILSYRKNVSVKVGDAWSKSFSSADVVFVFIMPEYMERFGEKMKSELKPGTVLVTYAYAIPQMEHYLHEGNAYFYKMS